jgi:hypothetical protein
MILVHGECGSGRTSALRALEASPPAGFQAVYVPVPTLDLDGVARWCLDRIMPGEQAEPVAALREFAKRRPLLLLLDDVERMPLATAEALARLAWESTGAITLIGACETAARGCAGVVALGVPELAVALDVGAEGRVEDAARAVRDQLAPSRRSGAARPASHTARASARLGGAEAPRPAPSAAPEEPRELVVPPPARVEPALPATAAPVAQREPRTVPLSLAIALAVTAFLVPVAFGAGVWVGRAGPAAREPREAAARGLPPVSAPAPQPPPPPSADAGEPPRTSSEELARSTTSVALTPPDRTLAPPVVSAPRSPAGLVARVEAPPAHQPAPRARASEPWETPKLLNVAPADPGRDEPSLPDSPSGT